jgi:pyruvate formate lyase activating enzyme
VSAKPVSPNRPEDEQGLSRRQALKAGLLGAAAFAGGAAAIHQVLERARATAQVAENAGAGTSGGTAEAGAGTAAPGGAQSAAAKAGTAAPARRGNPTEFKGDAPKGELWENWVKRGWAREGRHWEKQGKDVLCQLCANECLLEPESRGRCRNRVNKNGALYTLAYGNPCAVHVDPIEKKPLYHFLPETTAFSIATAGCCLRCLYCQNWEISQAKPEETKDPAGPEVRAGLARLERLSLSERARLSMFPDDVVALAEAARSRSIAYTYSEPGVFFEYMYDSAKLAREHRIKNVWVTCGYLREPGRKELFTVLDAANVTLKSLSEKMYRVLNTASLQPVLDTLLMLHREGVWFEVTHLMVPTYTDDLAETEKLCGWLVEKLGPDRPLHLLRFFPQHKLTHLPPTPAQLLLKAREVARKAGLRYVYVGGAPEIRDSGTTYCPNCKEAIIERRYMTVTRSELEKGCCGGCQTKIAGVWSA